MNELCNDLKSAVPELVQEWMQRTNRKPWVDLTEADRIDHMPDLLTALIVASTCTQSSLDARHEVIANAFYHGQHRRANHFSPDDMLIEYHFLRVVLWTYLNGRGTHLALAAINRIDAAISHATVASMVGYHGPDRVDLTPERVISDLTQRWS